MSKRKGSWDLLESLRLIDNQLWSVIGDFNEILSQREKLGERPRCENHLKMFRRVLESCSLFDLGGKVVYKPRVTIIVMIHLRKIG